MLNKFYELLNFLYYGYKRNNWMIDVSRHFRDYDNVGIDRPIFLLGVQGGGLTLISRMLRRNKEVVSVTGSHKYWAGADEMQNVLGPTLPPELTGIKHKVPPHPDIGKPRGWLYASNELIDEYRNSKEDVNPKVKEKFRKILRWVIHRNSARDGGVRFTDKSQIYTVKVSFINEILSDCDPKFILITRNPYAVCYRAPMKSYSLNQLPDKFSFMDKLELASQNYANSMRYALQDGNEVEDFTMFRFEDILESPAENIKKLCDFAELDFSGEMIPQPDHDIPFASMRRDRWYPLRTEVNKKYFEEIDEKHVEVIEDYCGKHAEQFGYERPL